MIYDLLFWKAAAERSIKTFAQTLAAVLGAGQVGLMDAPWGSSFSVAALAAVLSLLTSVASADLHDWQGPSLATEGVIYVRPASEEG